MPETLELISPGWGHEGEPPWWEECLLRKWRDWSSFTLCHVKTSAKPATCRPGRGPLPDTQSARTLNLDFQDLRQREINICWLSRSVYDMFVTAASKLRQCHKAEINLLARYIVIQRPHKGKTHFQAASSCWQYWFPWSCMTEVPIFLLQLSGGDHSNYQRMLSSPCHVASSLPEAPSHFKSISSEGTQSLLRAQLIRSGPLKITFLLINSKSTDLEP